MWSAELQEPAAHSAIDQIEVFAHLSNGQVLLAHELDDLEFVVRIKVATAAAFSGERCCLHSRCFIHLWRGVWCNALCDVLGGRSGAAQRGQAFECRHSSYALTDGLLQL